MKWSWQLPGWPEFTWDKDAMVSLEAEFLQAAGRAAGAYSHLDQGDGQAFRIEILSDEALRSSQIEGEVLDRASVQSSLRKNFGLQVDQQREAGLKEQGFADLLLETWRHFSEPLSDSDLCEWHGKLMRGQLQGEALGCYRSGELPMQIVSGDPFDPEIHFEAPPSDRMVEEMATFLRWFNATTPDKMHNAIPALTRSALAHLHFETIHPFSDGNGRIGRVIAEKVLSQAIGQPILIALSQAIEAQRKRYYEALAETRYTLDVTEWVTWFGEVVLQSIDDTLERIAFVIQKTHFFAELGSQLNGRQKKVLQRIFREGPSGFTGGLSAGNYMSISRTSSATARRDLGELVKLGALTRTGERKGTRYFLNPKRLN